jgi:hypothetical protein
VPPVLRSRTSADGWSRPPPARIRCLPRPHRNAPEERRHLWLSRPTRAVDAAPLGTGELDLSNASSSGSGTVRRGASSHFGSSATRRTFRNVHLGDIYGSREWKDSPTPRMVLAMSPFLNSAVFTARLASSAISRNVIFSFAWSPCRRDPILHPRPRHGSLERMADRNSPTRKDRVVTSLDQYDACDRGITNYRRHDREHVAVQCSSQGPITVRGMDQVRVSWFSQIAA